MSNHVPSDQISYVAIRQELLTENLAVKIVFLRSVRVTPGTRPVFSRHAGNRLADIPLCKSADSPGNETQRVSSASDNRAARKKRAGELGIRSDFVSCSLCNINVQFDSRQLHDTSARRKIKLTNELRD